jgi:NAD(P)-dependent dehydrogenase (short-subunit alcohol dehydrogenase family)
MTTTSELDGRVALVTGAGSGIGRAIARALAGAGAAVGALDHQEPRAEAIAAEIEHGGGRAVPLVADVSDAAQMRDAVAELGRRWDRIDVLVANAGINGVWAPLDEIEPEEWDRTIAVNLRGTFLTFRYAIPWLRRQGGAAVVTASVHGTRVFSTPGSTAYACAKSAQAAFTRKMAVELARDRIRVNTICPGYIETSIGESTFRRGTERIQLPVSYTGRPIPLTGGEPHQPDEVARLALFLLSDAASAITGTEVWIDGAMSLVVG